MCDGKTNHRTVIKRNGALHQSFAKASASHHHAAVLVLYGSSHNLCCTCRELIDQHHHLAFHQFAVALRTVFLPLAGSARRVDDEVVVCQELIGYLHGRLQIATAVLLQVHDKVFHTFALQVFHGCHELVVSGGTETADAYVAHTGTYQVIGVEGLHGNLVASYRERELVTDASAHDAQQHLRPFGSTQPAHDFVARHLHTGNGGVVYADDAVASQDAHLLRGTIHHRLNDEQRVVHHIELHAYSLKASLQGFVECLHFLRGGVRRVRIQFLQHAAYAVFRQFILVYRVYIEVVDHHLRHLQLAQRTVLAHA